MFPLTQLWLRKVNSQPLKEGKLVSAFPDILLWPKGLALNPILASLPGLGLLSVSGSTAGCSVVGAKDRMAEKALSL